MHGFNEIEAIYGKISLKMRYYSYRVLAFRIIKRQTQMLRQKWTAILSIEAVYRKLRCSELNFIIFIHYLYEIILKGSGWIACCKFVCLFSFSSSSYWSSLFMRLLSTVQNTISAQNILTPDQFCVQEKRSTNDAIFSFLQNFYLRFIEEDVAAQVLWFSRWFFAVVSSIPLRNVTHNQ